MRDRLLGRAVHDRDWLVLGCTAQQLEGRGFRPVGRHFTVFLAPGDAEEHALPRGVPDGSSGNDEADLLTDLARRDLTINAMALDGERLIDPHGGRADVERRLLRHVDARHFACDPLRVLRTARLAAELDFDIDPGTLQLMVALSTDGSLAACAPERLYEALQRGLGGPRPHTFVTVLRACAALPALLPEVDRLFGVPQPPAHHPEVDTGEHLLLALRMARDLGADAAGRFAVLVHDVGKGLTEPADWPGHRGHETRGVPLVEAVAARLRVPTRHRQLAVLTTREHLRCHRALQARPGTLLSILEAARVFSNDSLLDDLLLACEADARGRAGRQDRPYPQAAWLREAARCAARVRADAVRAPGLDGAALGAALREARLRALTALCSSAAR